MATKDLSSKCKKFRFFFDISFNSGNKVIFIGLNPSVGNKYKHDQTLKNVINIGKNMNYGRIIVINLFPYVTPYPIELRSYFDLNSKFNQSILRRFVYYWNNTNDCDIWIGWGNLNCLSRNKKNLILKIFDYINEKSAKPEKDIFILDTNKNGSPRHPLYISKFSTLRPMSKEERRNYFNKLYF